MSDSSISEDNVGVELTETAQKVLEERYYIDGESKWEHVVERVSSFFAENGEERDLFYRMMIDMNALPNSPVLMNAGTELTSYSACFVLPIEDNIESIYKYYSDAALISKSGGGVGANFSAIRHSGSKVGSTGNAASGPLSFMEVQNTSTDTIKQGGRRRGANMALLDVTHKDALDFIKAKDNPGVLENFNLSVRVDNDFMSMTNLNGLGGSWQGPLWDEMMERAHSSAEPGVIFGDTVERGNLVPHLGELNSVNPCGEQPLLPYESCSLIAINLSNIVRDGEIDIQRLRHTTYTATLFMNRVLDKSNFPVPECNDAMAKTRKIGVGIMGLHDMLIQLGVPYDSEEGCGIASEVMSRVSNFANYKSEEIGEERGLYLGWEEGCPKRRNAHLTTIAPTGTLSMIADCSSGCEPYFAPVTYKDVLDGTVFIMPNKWLPDDVKSQLEWGIKDAEELLSVEEWRVFKGAQDIHWRDHILMQAALQEHVDSAISKTINMPANSTVKDVKDAYNLAWTKGCKGLTVYVDGSRDKCVLSSSKEESTDTVAHKESLSPWKLELEDELDAKRYRVRDKDGSKIYFTVCTQDDDPVEVFATLPEEVSNSYWKTISRLVTLSLRHFIPLDEVTKALRKSSDSVSDNPARLARILDKYKVDGAYIPDDEVEAGIKGSRKSECPECSGVLVPEGGCWNCHGCGWSKCL